MLEATERSALLVLGPQRVKCKFEGNMGLTDTWYVDNESLVGVVRDVLSSGMRSKRLLSSRLHAWDYIERASALHTGTLASDPESLLAETVIAANQHTSWPRETKLEWLVAVGVSRKIMHVWLEMVRLVLINVHHIVFIFNLLCLLVVALS